LADDLIELTAELDGDESQRSRRRRVAPIVVGGVALLLAALFWVLVVAEPRLGDDDDGSSPLIGRVAPAATGELADGSPFALSRRKGSWVVLNFFTHNCVPCIREHPELIAFVDQQRSLGAQGAEFYTIVRDSTQQQVDEFFAERGGDWPIVYDPRFEFANGFGVALVPETWIIDDTGVVRARLITEVTAEGLGTLIRDLRGAA
jgi:cytochrome c biogenesis protein CcmG, thiol:disulfide interchange protein DsbE